MPPTSLDFKVDSLLNEATWGMYESWENLEAKKSVRRRVRDLLLKLAKVLDTGAFQFAEGLGWRLEVPNESAKKLIFDSLSRFSCETLELRREPEPDLFDTD
jgi:hypothetical protein